MKHINRILDGLYLIALALFLIGIIALGAYYLPMDMIILTLLLIVAYFVGIIEDD